MSFVGFGTIFSVVKEILGFFLGDDSITVEELKAALDDAVEAIRTHTNIAIEEHELQLARNHLETAIIDLGRYRDTPTKGLLDDAERSAISAWTALNNDVDLISAIGPGYQSVRGSGLLGHYWFLIAATLWATILEEMIRYYKENGSNDLAEGSRKSLRDLCIEPSISVAQAMQLEWLGWTRRRFSPLEVEQRLVPSVPSIDSPFPYSVRFTWSYWFNSQKTKAGEHIYDLNSSTALERAALEAEATRLNKIDAEVEFISGAIVEPSRQVVREWRKLLEKWNLKLIPDAVFESLEQAADAARGVEHRLLSDVLSEKFGRRWKKEPVPARLREASMMSKLGLARADQTALAKTEEH